MTISSSNRKAGPFNGNGTATVFPFEFRVFDASEVQVIFTDTSGIESTLEMDSHYLVTLNEDQASDPGGTITYPHPTAIEPLPPNLASGEKLTMLGNTEFTQELDLTNQGAFYPEAIESALDKLTMQTLQLKEQVGRAIIANVSSDIPQGQYMETTIAASEAAVAAAAQAQASEESVLPVIALLDEIDTLADVAPQIVEVAAHTDAVDDVGSSIGLVQAVGGDLAGTGWTHDLGAITDAAVQQQIGETSHIINVDAHMDDIVAVSENIAAVIAAPAAAIEALASAESAAASAAAAQDALDQMAAGVPDGSITSAKLAATLDLGSI